MDVRKLITILTNYFQLDRMLTRFGLLYWPSLTRTSTVEKVSRDSFAKAQIIQ